jgi:hypothetical protein
MSLHGLARPEFRATKEKARTRVKRSHDILQCIAMVDADDPGMDCIRGCECSSTEKTVTNRKAEKSNLSPSMRRPFDVKAHFSFFFP